MVDIYPKCGLPKDICVCDTLEKEEPHSIKIYIDKKRFGKLMTVIEGLDSKELKKVAKELKHMLSTGGTSKDGQIMLQGDHRKRAKDALVKMGYKEEYISIV